MVAEGNDVEALEQRGEALDQLRAAGSGDGGQGPAVKGALEGDDPVRSGRPRAHWKRRAILMHASMASAPELHTNTVSAKEWATSRSAKRSSGSLR